MKATKLISFTRIQLHALDKLSKAKNINEMLKENASFARQSGLENIRKNHHVLNRVLFDKVSQPNQNFSRSDLHLFTTYSFIDNLECELPASLLIP